MEQFLATLETDHDLPWLWAAKRRTKSVKSSEQEAQSRVPCPGTYARLITAMMLVAMVRGVSERAQKGVGGRG